MMNEAYIKFIDRVIDLACDGNAAEFNKAMEEELRGVPEQNREEMRERLMRIFIAGVLEGMK